MADVQGLADELFGHGRLERRATEPTGTATVFGRVTSRSDGGMVRVLVDGDHTAPEGGEADDEMETTACAEEGQTAVIQVVDGRPTVIGVVGGGDRLRAEASAAAGAAASASSVAAEASFAVSALREEAEAFREQAEATYSTKEEVDEATGAALRQVAASYVSKADAQASYATKAEVSQSADAVRASVAESYATKASVEGIGAPLFEGEGYDPDGLWVFLGRASLPVDSGGCLGSLRLRGRLGGWVAGNSGQVDVHLKARDDAAALNEVSCKDDTVDTRCADVLACVDGEGRACWWLELRGYWCAQLWAEAVQAELDGQTRAAQAPEGVVWRLSQQPSALGAYKAQAAATYSTKAELAVERGRITSEVSARAETDGRVEALATRVTQTEAGVTTAISAASSAQAAADGVSVGGRNLLAGSGALAGDCARGAFVNVANGYDGCVAGATDMAWSGPALDIGSALTRAGAHEGEVVTLSIRVSATSEAEVEPSIMLFRATADNYEAGIETTDPAHPGGSGVTSIPVTLRSGRWVRLSVTFAVTAYSLSADYARFECVSDTPYYILWSAPKLERGNRATDWTPAPEDVGASVAAAQGTADGAAAQAASTATLIRQYGSGVLVCRQGNHVGALVNASGSFDVVGVTWDGEAPTAGAALATFDADSVDFMGGIMQVAANEATPRLPGSGLTPQVVYGCFDIGYAGAPSLRVFANTYLGTPLVEAEGFFVAREVAYLNGGARLCDGRASITASEDGRGHSCVDIGAEESVALMGGDGSGWLVSDTGVISGTASLLRVDSPSGTAVRFVPDVLFDNPSQPMAGAVTLSRSAADYNHMRIYFKNNNNLVSSVDVCDPNGKTVALTSAYFSVSSTAAMFLKTKAALISGTTINTLHGDAYATGEARIDTGAVTRGDYIAITRVEAWNE